MRQGQIPQHAEFLRACGESNPRCPMPERLIAPRLCHWTMPRRTKLCMIYNIKIISKMCFTEYWLLTFVEDLLTPDHTKQKTSEEPKPWIPTISSLRNYIEGPLTPETVYNTAKSINITLAQITSHMMVDDSGEANVSEAALISGKETKSSRIKMYPRPPMILVEPLKLDKCGNVLCPRLMIIKNGISMICDKSTCGLHHILGGYSMSHLLRIMATRDGHMDTFEVLVYPANILFVILV
ncbi:hypothetical protein RND71_009775 [Anisodus tanguticus]|uniref:Uncharacterized protein n=1 Tax=Anisodus tanguticus TaxID=243964 RepID=A0AAE1VS58_9SOLA|nr:hypothetical protein RND71_009775 [Anisodus tanguticus]